MDCERVAELLPWLLNGTLGAAEQALSRAHLAQCEKCRQELAETAFAAAVYQQHVPTEALVDYAFSRPVLERDLIERHLATCPECAEQLELARESRRLERDEGTPTGLQPELPPPAATIAKAWPIRLWQYGALAASLIGLFALGGWLWSWQQARSWRASLTEQQRAMDERLARLEAENQALRRTATPAPTPPDQAREEVARLQARVKELASPQANVPVLEIYPQELAQRGERPAVNQLEVPPGAKVITLILNSQSTSQDRQYELEVTDSRGRVVWAKPGLVRQPTGDYTLSLPAELLPPGSYQFNIYRQTGGRRHKVESYQVRLNRAHY